MKKNSELVWEFSLAWVAFAGGATLLANFFPFIPTYTFGLLFVAGFIFMLVSFGIRLHENSHPVLVVTSILLVNTLEDNPSIDLTLAFTSREKVNINNFVSIRFPKELDNKLKQVATFEPYCFLDDANVGGVVPIESGQYVECSPHIELHLRPGCCKDDIEKIDFAGSKVQAVWSIIGYKNSFTKLDCIHIK